MSELNKFKSEQRYFMFDPQNRAIEIWQELNKLPFAANDEKEKLLKSLLGSCGKNVSIKPGFYCDMGYNIHVRDNFLTKCNVIILNMAEVNIGNNVWKYLFNHGWIKHKLKHVHTIKKNEYVKNILFYYRN